VVWRERAKFAQFVSADPEDVVPKWDIQGSDFPVRVALIINLSVLEDARRDR
jgi:hypothetical protein